MSRLNIFLLIVVLGCALSVVNATNQQRRLFVQLERAQSEERQLQQDYAQLQYEQSALSKTSRIEQVATASLKMQAVATGGTQYLTLAPGASVAAEAPIPVAVASAPAQGRAGRPAAKQPARASAAVPASVKSANRGGAR
ncbi:cell division protein FtsL [Trinickia fusca]|uniref:Cell division protein FtsL n=1 Tax=Trinickia fusca TaxID=2419777 RepID=A0A494XSW8_9BURK|nr:cell division protein FtsL [Trinickia fusca]RKP51204.1 cell division protein FtsL [Trinickia fusca]